MLKRGNLKAWFLTALFLIATLSSVGIFPSYAYPEYDYDLAGAWNEDGYRDGSINCTLYRHFDSPYSFELDGTENITDYGMVLSYNLGFNQSRTYYLKDANESIYVIKPTAPYYTYSITVIDFLGVTNGFVETLINLNGTDTVVERFPSDLLIALPFTLSWGRAYKLRLVCDRGTYYFPTIVAGATTTATLAITSDMFPKVPTDLSKLVVTARRHNITYIKSVYFDAAENTTWIYMAVSENGKVEILESTNVTDHSLTWNWYGADPSCAYYVRIIVLHDVRGIMEWTIVCPLPPPETGNPWSVLDDVLGTKGSPILPSQFMGMGIVLLTVAAFSRQNVGVGLVVMVLVAMFFTYIQWLSMSMEWLGLTLAIAVLIAFSINKGDSRI